MSQELIDAAKEACKVLSLAKGQIEGHGLSTNEGVVRRLETVQRKLQKALYPLACKTSPEVEERLCEYESKAECPGCGNIQTSWHQSFVPPKRMQCVSCGNEIILLPHEVKVVGS